jgi:cytoskeletal protein RodZ
MARPPDDPNYYSDDEPTAYANYGDQSGDASYGQPAAPEPPPKTPWHQKPAAMVAGGAVAVIVLAFAIYGIIKVMADESSTSNTVTTTSSTSPTTTSAAVAPPATETQTETPTETTTTTDPSSATTTTTTTTPSTSPSISTVTETRTETQTVTQSPTSEAAAP